MPGDMKKKPPHFDNAEEYYTSPRSTATEKSEEPESDLPSELPPPPIVSLVTPTREVIRCASRLRGSATRSCWASINSNE